MFEYVYQTLSLTSRQELTLLHPQKQNADKKKCKEMLQIKNTYANGENKQVFYCLPTTLTVIELITIIM